MRVLFLNPPFHPRFSREQRSPAVTKVLADRLNKEDRIEIRYAIATDLALSDTPESVTALEAAASDFGVESADFFILRQ